MSTSGTTSLGLGDPQLQGGAEGTSFRAPPSSSHQRLAQLKSKKITELTDEERKEKLRLTNRESARRLRRKRMDETADMMNEVQKLREENSLLLSRLREVGDQYEQLLMENTQIKGELQVFRTAQVSPTAVPNLQAAHMHAANSCLAMVPSLANMAAATGTARERPMGPLQALQQLQQQRYLQQQYAPSAPAAAAAAALIQAAMAPPVAASGAMRPFSIAELAAARNAAGGTARPPAPFAPSTPNMMATLLSIGTLGATMGMQAGNVDPQQLPQLQPQLQQQYAAVLEPSPSMPLQLQGQLQHQWQQQRAALVALNGVAPQPMVEESSVEQLQPGLVEGQQMAEQPQVELPITELQCERPPIDLMCQASHNMDVQLGRQTHPPAAQQPNNNHHPVTTPFGSSSQQGRELQHMGSSRKTTGATRPPALHVGTQNGHNSTASAAAFETAPSASSQFQRLPG